MRSLVAASAVLLALGLVAGCGDGDGGSDANTTAVSGEQASFIGVPWVLAGGLEVPGWQQAPPSATFAGKTVGGSTGCNHFTAPFTVDGDSLKIGKIASTLMACPPPAGAVERAYVDALERVASWRLDGSRLVLLDDQDRELLVYEQASPVGEWQATSIQTGDALASPLPGTEITATFAADGTLSGFAGCNRYTSSYSTEGGGIKIAPPAATKKACVAPEGVTEQESAYLAVLPTAAQFRLEGESLALLRADGTYAASYVRAGAR